MTLKRAKELFPLPVRPLHHKLVYTLISDLISCFVLYVYVIHVRVPWLILVFELLIFLFQEPPADESREEEQEIVPGGDPDAGMPAEAAEIHGTERGGDGGDHDNEPEQPPSPPPLDAIDDVTNQNTGSVKLQETD